MKKVILAGGTGFLGDVLAKHFIELNYEVFIISRQKKENQQGITYLTWDGENWGDWAKSLENAEVLINLAGRTVNCRYNAKNKQEIYDSRLKSTAILGEAILKCENPPKLWINSSSATIYRHALDRPMDELTGEYGSGFSVDVCQKWEAAFNQCNTPNTRKVALRMAMVLGKNGGVMIPFINMVRLGLGGTQASGKQYISWIHEQDFANMIQFIVENPKIEGAFNCSAPNPMPNQDFLKTLRNILKVPFGLPAAKWMLEIGAWAIGTETELLLKSRRVVPTKMLDLGFEFKYPTVREAFTEIIHRAK